MKAIVVLQALKGQGVAEFCAKYQLNQAQLANCEAVLRRNVKNGKLAVCLINWTYCRKSNASRLSEPVTLQGVEIRVRNAKGVTRATSAWLDRDLKVERKGAGCVIMLPQLAEADVLLLE